MTVYVDDMNAQFGRMKMCHMISETEAELHAMADRIGVARKWHQGDHYDIALSKRALAVAAGAVEVTLRECGVMTVHRRKYGVLMPLADARAYLTELAAKRDARPVPWQPTPEA